MPRNFIVLCSDSPAVNAHFYLYVFKITCNVDFIFLCGVDMEMEQHTISVFVYGELIYHKNAVSCCSFSIGYNQTVPIWPDVFATGLYSRPLSNRLFRFRCRSTQATRFYLKNSILFFFNSSFTTVIALHFVFFCKPRGSFTDLYFRHWYYLSHRKLFPNANSSIIFFIDKTVNIFFLAITIASSLKASLSALCIRKIPK